MPLKRHTDKNKTHDSALIAMENFMENFIIVMEGKSKGIDRQMSSLYDQTVSRNREIMRVIIETIILCGKSNTAFRGHTKDKSNFVEILKYRSVDNPILKKHLEKHLEPKEKHSCSYLSPQIQNEIIDICGNVISSDIIQAYIYTYIYILYSV